MPHSLDAARLSAAAAMACSLHQRAALDHRRIAGVAHAFGVCGLVIDHKGGADLAVAALLQGAQKLLRSGEDALIAERFGKPVLALLEAAQDPDRPFNYAWTEKRRYYLDRLEHAGPEALLLVCADALFQSRRIVSDLWSEGQAALRRMEAGKSGTLWYFGSLTDLLMRKLSSPMARDLSTTVLEMHRLAGV
jgi:hypothetical protein